MIKIFISFTLIIGGMILLASLFPFLWIIYGIWVGLGILRTMID